MLYLLLEVRSTVHPGIWTRLHALRLSTVRITDTNNLLVLESARLEALADVHNRTRCITGRAIVNLTMFASAYFLLINSGQSDYLDHADDHRPTWHMTNAACNIFGARKSYSGAS